MTDKFPGWRYGPGGKSAIFESEGDVPRVGKTIRPRSTGTTLTVALRLLPCRL